MIIPAVRVLLVRHGESLSEVLKDNDNLARDEANGLTEVGTKQAVSLGRHFLAELGTARLVTSPIRRARETAELIAGSLNAKVHVDARLSERSFGFPPNTTVSESRLLQEESYLFPENAFPGGESILQHRARVASWLAEFEASIPQDSCAHIVVTHGGTIEHIHGCLYSSPLVAMAKAFTSCGTGHFNIWSVINLKNRSPIWRLDAVDHAPRD